MGEQLNAGDTVRLKSGGPLMTIEEIAEYFGRTGIHAKCVWFKEKTKSEELFKLSSLKKDEEEE